jgi:hypothetical protein
MAKLKADAEAAAPMIESVRAEIEAAAQAIRDEFADMRGFPPMCRTLVYERREVGRRKWRWKWTCRWGCGYSVYDAALPEPRRTGVG